MNEGSKSDITQKEKKGKEKQQKAAIRCFQSSDFQGLNSYWVLSNTWRKKKTSTTLVNQRSIRIKLPLTKTYFE